MEQTTNPTVFEQAKALAEQHNITIDQALKCLEIETRRHSNQIADAAHGTQKEMYAEIFGYFRDKLEELESRNESFEPFTGEKPEATANATTERVNRRRR